MDAVCNSIRNATSVHCVGDGKPDFQADLQARNTNQVKRVYRAGWVPDYPVNANFLKELYHSKAK
ncbi:ABC transporter substrate-binding protein [Streptomyces tanashiensis]